MTKPQKTNTRKEKSNASARTNLVASKSKTRKLRGVPPGYHTVTPYLIVKQATKAIDFYKTAFGAREVARIEYPKGKIRYAELKIGDSKIMLTEASLGRNRHSPQDLQGSPVFISLYVRDVDAMVKQAVAAGAKLLQPVENRYYGGDRSADLQDPYGHKWFISTRIARTSMARIKKRAIKWYKKNEK